MSVVVDLEELAGALGWRPARVRATLDARLLTDEQLHEIVGGPGQMRRHRRSTLVRIARAFGLPDTTVDEWCAAAPEAIAAESKGRTP